MLLGDDPEDFVADHPGEAHHEHEMVLEGVHEVITVALVLLAVGVHLR
jgi:hypothetical protein